jgi:vancomycin resistance protein YoaR
MIRLKFTGLLSILMLIQQPANHDVLTLIDNDQPIMTVDREELVFPLPNTPLMDLHHLDILTAELSQQVYIEPKNAILDEHGNLQPEQLGYQLDKRAFHTLYHSYFYSKGAKTLKVPKKPIYPEVDSELLSRIRQQAIGYYVTYFNSYNTSRTNNIRKSSEAINNYVLFPGQTFSFNEVVGQRTKERGYMPAPIIVRGELSKGVGGGICQVSSTLFNAVDRAGLKIVKRYSHSKRVPYVPPGRDATVSWYGPDFVFMNNYKHPILVRSKVRGGSVSILLYTSDDVNVEHNQVPSMYQ